jgi:hypothetical protein
MGQTAKEPVPSNDKLTKMCRPLEVGGLDIRDLRTMNDAMLLKLVWQIVSQQDRVWMQVMKAKYFPNQRLWEVQRDAHISPPWRRMLEIRQNIKPEVQWILANGTNVQVWYQPWMPNWDQQIPRLSPRYDTVSQLVDPNIK